MVTSVVAQKTGDELDATCRVIANRLGMMADKARIDRDLAVYCLMLDAEAAIRSMLAERNAAHYATDAGT